MKNYIDWTKDNTWTNDKQALFQTPTSAQLANTETGTVTIFPACPAVHCLALTGKIEKKNKRISY